jgi:5-methylcytosine-specific restriction protein A
MNDTARRNGYPILPAKRWTKDANGRTLPLNSAAWGKLRRQVLAEVPLCEYCPPGVITPAVAVDHKNNNPADNTRSNLASVCTSCHSVKTASDMHGTVPRMGCDEQGNPRAPSHHWNQAAVGRSGGLADDCQKSPEVSDH